MRFTQTSNMENKETAIHESGLNIIENEDGSFTFEWNRDDKRWSWMNDLTDEQIKNVIENALSEMVEYYDE